MADSTRIPTVYIPHGGGPWPFVDLPMVTAAEKASLAGYLRSLADVPSVAPSAVLVVSAHWEEPEPTVMATRRPPLLFDYYGFPQEAYDLTWPAPGDPELAERVCGLLEGAGIRTGKDLERGFDHGTFVPLVLTYPDAQLPTVQLSLRAGLDPAEHIEIGAALAPLRDEGVFIIGSGMSFHNMQAFASPDGAVASAEFDDWLYATMQLDSTEIIERIIAWEKAPSARFSHPREEHLLPLMVVAGAGGADRASVPFRDTVLGTRVCAVQFG